MRKISRRTMLHGSCATITLPWLDIMLPCRHSSPFAEPVRRIAFMYIPNGVISQHWFPENKNDDTLAPQSLRPLEAIRDEVTVINGLSRTYISGEPHSQCGSCWLTSASLLSATGATGAIDVTLDQVIGRKVGEQTPFPSLELSCNSFLNNAEPKLYDSISWYGPGNDAKSMNEPASVFERMFGRAVRINQSVLDTVMDDAKSLRSALGVADRRKIDEYLESVRAIESRLNKQDLSRRNFSDVQSPVPDSPPINRGDYIRLMGDLMILAFKTDQTRVATLMVGPERWETPQLYDSLFEQPVNHHQMTHDDTYDAQVALIDRFHVEQFVYLVKQMRDTLDGNATLLDNTFFVLGAGLGDGNSHSFADLPIVIAGKGGLEIEGGRRIDCPKGTPLANLWLLLGQQMGVPMESFADSTGSLKDYVG